MRFNITIWIKYGIAQSPAVHSFGFQIKRRLEEKTCCQRAVPKSQLKRLSGHFKPIFGHSEDIERDRDLARADNSIGAYQTQSAVTDGEIRRDRRRRLRR